MPQIIILLLILAALVILAVQNLSVPVSLVILGSSKTPELPLGLLLVGAIGIGAFITLILYGLVGLQRLPDSKYRPLGRRVPYPENPGSSPTTGTPYSPAAPYSSNRSSSTAFVSEPKAPQDSAPPDSTQSSAQDREPYDQAPFSTFTSSYREASSAPEPQGTLKKPLFPFLSKQKKKGRRGEPVENVRIGDDWGEKRTAEHLNSWDTYSRNDQGTAGQQRGFFDFMGGSPQANNNPAQDYRPDYDYDEDLDGGWDNFDGYDDSSRPLDRVDRDLDSPSDRPLDNNRPLDNRGRRVYRDGLYGDDYEEGYREEGYKDDVYEVYEEDDVYEADYRVIVPPSKPLNDREDDN
jgi:uncharacterized integral membrane protein